MRAEEMIGQFGYYISKSNNFFDFSHFFQSFDIFSDVYNKKCIIFSFCWWYSNALCWIQMLLFFFTYNCKKKKKKAFQIMLIFSKVVAHIMQHECRRDYCSIWTFNIYSISNSNYSILHMIVVYIQSLWSNSCLYFLICDLCDLFHQYFNVFCDS